MKAKLIKVVIGDEYRLDDENGVLIASSLYSSKNKLSLKNCQAIERGYDLDEIAEQKFPYDFDCPLFETLGITEKSHKSILIGMLQGTLQKGFQKALELMEDKKFSEDDMKRVFIEGSNWTKDESLEEDTTFGQAMSKSIQSLQQTEWDVEIEIDEEKDFIFDPAMGISQGFYLEKPKLDADDCIILKLVKS